MQKLKLTDIISILAITLIFGACSGPTQKTDVSSLKDEVMAVHDEVMPKMGELRKTEKALRSMAQEVDDSLTSSDITSAANAIKLANENMMVWMRNYDPAFEGTDEEIKNYLEAQKDGIEKVREDMLSSLETGNKILNQ